MSTERSASGSWVPRTSSVDPPPMSTTRNGPGSSSPTVAPVNDSRASSSPVSSSGAKPSTSVASRKNSSRFAASRAALVAVARVRVTWCASIASRYSCSTTSVRSIASGANERAASTPWPRRVMRIRRSIVFMGPSAASRSATSRRTEFVPMSTAATRLTACRARGAPRPSAPPGRRRPRGTTRSARGGT